LFGDLVDAAANLPRPDILTCAYVLHPLADLAPDLVHPTKAQTMGQLKASYQFDQIVLPTQYQF
jgi:7,8-dihydro-6-hydroxymethylpterin-pyrophosphokinase